MLCTCGSSNYHCYMDKQMKTTLKHYIFFSFLKPQKVNQENLNTLQDLCLQSTQVLVIFRVDLRFKLNFGSSLTQYKHLVEFLNHLEVTFSQSSYQGLPQHSFQIATVGMELTVHLLRRYLEQYKILLNEINDRSFCTLLTSTAGLCLHMYLFFCFPFE